MSKKFLLVLIILICLFDTACNRPKKEKPIARVYNKYLYYSDFYNILPDDITPQDSIQIVNTFIHSWIKNEVILHKAEENLTDEDIKSVNELIEQYRNSLILYNFESKIIEKHSDTLVTEDEIINYYDNNKNNFILSENIVKLNYLILPITDIKPLSFFKDILQNSEKNQELIQYCNTNAISYRLDNKWIALRNINTILPSCYQLNKKNINNNKFFDFNDTIRRYIIYIKDFQLSNNNSPLEYIHDNIKNIIINKRKAEIIKDIENKLYNIALDNNEIEIYQGYDENY